MILTQYYLGCLAHASYLVGDEESGTAAVVDPRRDVDEYLADSRRQGLEIRHVFLTHFHADFVAGHLELRDRVGARIYLGRRATAEYAFTPLGDRDRVEYGSVRLEVLETPGHSPESISILVYDLHESDRVPRAVLSGDTLFIGDVGRPDLRASVGWSAVDLAGLLHDSLRDKILPLPDETLVYPAHGAGSLCGKKLSTDTVSTIGIQRAYNYALSPMSRDRFIETVTADLPDAPAGSYATWCGTILDPERPIVLIAEPGREVEAATRLGRIAFDTVAGYLAGGMQSLSHHPDLIDRIERITAASLAEQLSSPAPPLLVDVRAPSEWEEERIDAAVNVPLSRLSERLDSLPRHRRIVVHCATGYRSAIAAGLLERAGFGDVADLVGGLGECASACRLRIDAG